MKFIITHTLKKTEPQYFKAGNLKLTMIPFKSDIKGLKICLEHANGENFTTTIFNTNDHNIKNIDITLYGYVWFEYLLTDKEYVIELVID